MRRKPLFAWLTLSIFLLASTAAIAEVYRWTDDSGKVVFGDTPPKNKKATAVPIKNTENSGTQFAGPQQIRKLKQSSDKHRQKKPPGKRNKISSFCRRYISQLNRVDLFLQHTDSPLDQQKARDLRKLIKQTCPANALKQKFDDGWCKRYRQKLRKTEIFLEHTDSPRDRQRVKDLRQQIARECQ